LRGGATVIATTRFPVDSALRFLKNPISWIGTQLENSWIDLRHIPSVEIFAIL
jgi:hypothetical protein